MSEKLAAATRTCPHCGAWMATGWVTGHGIEISVRNGLTRRDGGKWVELSPNEATILAEAVLAYPDTVSEERLLRSLYGHVDNEPEQVRNSTGVMMCRLRKKIEPLGLRIGRIQKCGRAGYRAGAVVLEFTDNGDYDERLVSRSEDLQPVRQPGRDYAG